MQSEQLIEKVLPRLVEECEVAWKIVVAMLPAQEQEDCGGFLTVLWQGLVPASVSWDSAAHHWQTQYGDPGENRAQRRRNSIEKLLRLGECHEQHGHLLSWQSKDEAHQLYGGGVYVSERLMVAFSGLPQEADEAMVLLGLVRAQLLTLKEADYRASLSQNPFWEEARTHCPV